MIAFSVVGNGELVEDSLFQAVPTPKLTLSLPNNSGFTPIGPGLPLTVEVVHVYTGKYPGGISHSSPMLITSAVKNLDQTGAMAESVNFLLKRVGRRSNFPAPPSDTQGTKLISYIPAVTAVSTSITLNLAFETFPDAVFDEIGQVFSGIAGLPIFLTQSPYIFGAGFVLKLVQDIGDAIGNKSVFSPTFGLNFTDIGEPSTAGYRNFIRNEDDPNTDFSKLKFVPNVGLADPATQNPYNGDAPYFVIAIDGAKRDELKGFAPLAATAQMLGTFFNLKDGGSIPVNDILNVFKAKNDIDFGRKVLETKKAIADATAAGQDTTKLQQQLNAYLADIQDTDLATLFKNAQ